MYKCVYRCCSEVYDLKMSSDDELKSEVVIDEDLREGRESKRYKLHKKKRYASKINKQRGSDSQMARAGKADKILCRFAFLSGETNPEKLMEIGGCCSDTLINSWLPEFERDKKKAFLGFKDNRLALAVTDNELKSQEAYTQELMTISSQVLDEIKQTEDLSKSLEKIIKSLKRHPNLDSADFGEVCSVLKSFTLVREAKAKSITLYMKTMNEWLKQSGVSAFQDGAAARVKEAERLRGKDDAGRDPLLNNTEAELTLRPVNKNPFAL